MAAVPVNTKTFSHQQNCSSREGHGLLLNADAKLTRFSRNVRSQRLAELLNEPCGRLQISYARVYLI